MIPCAHGRHTAVVGSRQNVRQAIAGEDLCVSGNHPAGGAQSISQLLLLGCPLVERVAVDFVKLCHAGTSLPYACEQIAV